MVFYFLITAVTIALAGLMDAVWMRPGQEAGSAGPCAGQAAGSAASRNGRRVCGIPSSGGGLFSAGVSRCRAFDIVCLAAIFLILAGVSALRLEVGNDYGKYVENFHEIWAGTDQAYVVTEAGFKFVVWLIYTISGYENYLLVFAVFGAVTAFLFLKALYEQSDCFWQSFAMFMLLGVYFRTFTTVRYYLALAAALYGIRFVLRRQYGCFVIWIGIAALFHKSVLMVLPLYLLAVLPWKKWIAPALTVIGGIGFVFQRPLLNLALTWYPTYRDTVYLSQDIGLKANASGILRCVLVFMLAAVVGRCGMEKEQNRFCLKLNFFGLLFYTCGSFLPLVSRMSYYMITPQLLLIPGLLGCVENRKRKNILTALVGIVCLGYFLWFLKTASGSGMRVLPYKTWIFTDKEWINGADFF